MKRETWRRVENVLAAVALCSFATFTFLQLWFCNSSPRLIDQASGAVNLVDCHGTLIYLTNPERLVSGALLYASVALIGVAIAIDIRIKPFGIEMPPD
ncbi:hypothetical protein [Bradyrhizobium erythrophlei]|jgi:hypothetical protein|uniref:Uncharacterized protein n=1 Tax=Bradyrhizobium erythrophlei TaxID=1437360 RepID=A0A1M5NBU7_9BRAD|nr:hypothetical protein [Bradyrhizobium erythrophlei]SHG86977.1 hypothetical protein SAMN05444169_4546 [Bradyrhizobium erythrophlei]